MDEIKLVDLRKDTLNTVKEAIKIASSIGASGFKLFVNPNLVKNGLISTRIVPVSTDSPPKSQLMINFAGLKNLKTTLEFAKKILGETGEVEVPEKATEPAQIEETVKLPAFEDTAPVVAVDTVAEDELEEASEEKDTDATEDLKPAKKTKRKKKSSSSSAEEETE